MAYSKLLNEHNANIELDLNADLEVCVQHSAEADEIIRACIVTAAERSADRNPGAA